MKSDIMIVSVILEADPKNTKSIQYMVIDIELRLKYDIRKLYVLLNTDIQENFFFQHIMIEKGLKADLTIVNIIAADSYIITIYECHDVDIATIDSRKESYVLIVFFIVTDIKKYDTILDFL